MWTSWQAPSRRATSISQENVSISISQENVPISISQENVPISCGASLGVYVMRTLAVKTEKRNKKFLSTADAPESSVKIFKTAITSQKVLCYTDKKFTNQHTVTTKTLSTQLVDFAVCSEAGGRSLFSYLKKALLKIAKQWLRFHSWPPFEVFLQIVA